MYGLLPFLKDIMMCGEQQRCLLYETVEKHQMTISHPTQIQMYCKLWTSTRGGTSVCFEDNKDRGSFPPPRETWISLSSRHSCPSRLWIILSDSLIQVKRKVVSDSRDKMYDIKIQRHSVVDLWPCAYQTWIYDQKKKKKCPLGGHSDLHHSPLTDASHFCQPHQLISWTDVWIFIALLKQLQHCALLKLFFFSPCPSLRNHHCLWWSDASLCFLLFKPSINLSYLSISSSIVAELCRRCHLLQFNDLQINGCLMVELTYRASIYHPASSVCPSVHRSSTPDVSLSHLLLMTCR